MASKSKKRFLSHWSIRMIFGKAVLCGFEHHAGRWVTDRIVWQGYGAWRGQDYYQWHCENGRYLTVGPAAPPEMWDIYNTGWIRPDWP